MTRRLPGWASTELLERLKTAQPSRRGGSAAAFTREEIEGILDARARGVSWVTINAMLPIPYTRSKHLCSAVLRTARNLGIEIPESPEP